MYKLAILDRDIDPPRLAGQFLGILVVLSVPRHDSSHQENFRRTIWRFQPPETRNPKSLSVRSDPDAGVRHAAKLSSERVVERVVIGVVFRLVQRIGRGVGCRV
jgi:hypothetical protein